MNLNDLKETRASKFDEMKTLHAKDKLDDADEKRFKELETEARDLDIDIVRAEKIAAFEREQESSERIGGNETRSLTDGFSLAKAVNEGLAGRLTGREAEYAQERQRHGEQRSGNGIMIAVPTEIILGGEIRALTTTAPGAGPGSNLIATDLTAMTDRRRANLAIQRMGATVLSNLTGDLDLPRLNASGSAGWVAEHTDAARSDAQFEKKSMGPKTATAEYEVSRRMLLQTTALDTVLRNDLSFLLSQSLDSAAIRGGGTNEPTGIISDASVLTVTGGPFDSDIAANLIAALETDNVTGTTGFLTNPSVMNTARKTKDGDGHVIPLAELFHSERVESSTQVPGDLGVGTDKNALIYGEWASLYLGYWSGIDLLVNPYHADVASKGGVLLHAFLDCDVVVRHPEGFRYAEID